MDSNHSPHTESSDYPFSCQAGGSSPIRIAELSRRSGVPIATIKFYLRLGILPRGLRTAPNQAVYDESHLRRLALIGSLQQAGLSLAAIKQSLSAMDTMRDDAPDFMAIAVGALVPYWHLPDESPPDPTTAAHAAAILRTMVERRHWLVDETVPIYQEVIRALALILSEWTGPFDEADLERYAAIAEELAAFELPDTWSPSVAPAEALMYVVQGTILFEPLILALRRLAHVDRGRKLRAHRKARAAAGPAQEAQDGPLPKSGNAPSGNGGSLGSTSERED